MKEKLFKKVVKYDISYYDYFCSEIFQDEFSWVYMVPILNIMGLLVILVGSIVMPFVHFFKYRKVYYVEVKNGRRNN